MKSDARQTLADFLVREIGKGSERAWAKAHGLRPDDVRRARSGKFGVTIDKLDTFGKALGVEVWQLLYPGFERSSPLFKAMSVEAIDVARQVDKITDEEMRRKAFAAILRVIEMGTDVPAEPAQLVEPPKPSPQSMRSPARSGRR